MFIHTKLSAIRLCVSSAMCIVKYCTYISLKPRKSDVRQRFLRLPLLLLLLLLVSKVFKEAEKEIEFYIAFCLE